jgi:hypothetical protein
MTTSRQPPPETTSARARRVEVPRELRGGGALGRADYASAFALQTPDAGASSAEQWARATFEDAPALLRRGLVMGWTFALGLRLGPKLSPTHVLGWPIAAAEADSITLQTDSRVLGAQNVIVVSESEVVWVTLVRFDRRIARPLWAATAPIHHLTIPYLLTRANRSPEAAQLHA